MMMNYKRLGLGVGIVIVLVFIGGFIWFNKKNEDDILSSWGNTYYMYLDSKEKENVLPDEASDAFVKFYQINDTDPLMVINYKMNEENYNLIYFIKDEKVNEIKFEESTNIDLFFNTEKDSYDYYLSVNGEEESYMMLEDYINSSIEAENDEILFEPMYTFSALDKIEAIVDGDNLVLKKRDEIFIRIDEQNEGFSYVNGLGGKNLKKLIKKSVDDSLVINDILTEDILESIEVRRKEILELKDKIVSENNKLSMDEVFNMLKGVWFCEVNSDSFFGYTLEIKIRNNKKYLIWGYFASEAFLMGEIKDIKYVKDDVYEFTVGEEKVEIDIKNRDNKKIVLNDDTYKYIAKNVEKAYEIILK